jgi:hypothetical protein
MTWGSNDTEPRGEPWPLEVSLKILEGLQKKRDRDDLDQAIGAAIAVGLVALVYIWLFVTR